MGIISDSLFDPLQCVQSLLVYNRRRIYIDNVGSRMHYVFTCILLIASALLVTSKIFMGEPINCIADPNHQEMINQYCYIHSTFTRARLDKDAVIYEPAKENEIYPGVRPGLPSEGVKIHSYYQWVWIALIAQTVAFYFPHWAWEKLERGTTMMLVGDLNLPMLSNEKKRRQRRKILTYLHRNEGYHQRYALFYALSEVGNLVNIIIQLVLTNVFLDNSFTTYGLKVFQLTLERPYQRDDRLARVFPTVTACRMATGGVAFGREMHDILCVLSINIVHEKVYIVLWFWFLIVLIASVVCLIYRLLTLHSPFRAFMLKRRLRESAHHCIASSISTNHKYGEWFLIYRLSQNMDPVTFGDLINQIGSDFVKMDVASGEAENKYALDEPPASVAHSPVYVNTKLLHV